MSDIHPTSQTGAVLFFTVLIIGTAMVIALTSLSRASIDTFVNARTQESARGTRAHVFGCLDELYIQLQADSAFTSSTITTPDVTCELTLTNTGGDNREAQLSLTEGSITRGVFVELSVSPVIVSTVKEQF